MHTQYTRGAHSHSCSFHGDNLILVDVIIFAFSIWEKDPKEVVFVRLMSEVR